MLVISNKEWDEEKGYPEHHGGMGAVWMVDKGGEDAPALFSTYSKAVEYVNEDGDSDGCLIIPLYVDFPNFGDKMKFN